MSTDLANVRKEFKSQLPAVAEQWAPMLPPQIELEKFEAVVMTAVMQDPKLLQADRRSLWQASMKAAQDGLLPDKREAVLLPYWDKRTQQNIVQYIPMYQGLQKRARQSGEVAGICARAVHEKDEFSFVYGDDEKIVHKPAMNCDRGPIIAGYAIITLKSGEKVREVLTRHDIEKIKAMSKTGDKGPWGSWEEEMVRKSALRRAAKWAPWSADLPSDPANDDDAPQMRDVSPEAWMDPPTNGTSTEDEPQQIEQNSAAVEAPASSPLHQEQSAAEVVGEPGNTAPPSEPTAAGYPIKRFDGEIVEHKNAIADWCGFMAQAMQGSVQPVQTWEQNEATFDHLQEIAQGEDQGHLQALSDMVEGYLNPQNASLI